jgi:hypothetical protein
VRIRQLEGDARRTVGHELPTRGEAPTPAILGALFLLATCQAAAADPPAAADAVGKATADRVLPEVTVQAQRNALTPRVREFLADSLDLENNEGATRWNSPICPAVVGLERDQAEFILARLSQIARGVGVELAGDHCSPANLSVFATAQPTSFLEKWSKMRHQRMFGDAMPSVITRFIETPRPVRVRYNSVEGPANGGMKADEHVIPGMFSAGSADTGQLANFGARAPVFTNQGEGDSRITRTAAWSLSSVFVVVDTAQLKGVKVGQLADYIAVSTLARIKPDARHGDAPTILGLFDGAGAQPVAGMTSWDDAFLDALYHTDPALVRQRGILISRMVSHIVREPSP